MSKKTIPSKPDLKNKLVKFIKARPYDFAAIIIVIIGVLIRLIQFPSMPAGFNQDELSAVYESYSLATEYTDRWGNFLPPYFPSWGSGQNVLQSYVTIPFIRMFGISLLAARLPYLIFGILLGALAYLSVSKAFNKKIGLGTLLLVLFQPWHFMMYRWALESNLLPVMFLAGIYALQLGIAKKIPVYLAMIPMALSFYAYGIAVFIIPVYLSLFMIANIKSIWNERKRWAIALCIFILIVTPFSLFFLKNNVVKHDLPFEKILPFSLPDLPINRLDQIDDEEVDIFEENKIILFKGMYDGLIWNSVKDFPPFKPILLKLSFFGIALFAAVNVKKVKRILKNPYFHYVIAVLPILFLIPLNVNRANLIFLPIMVFSTYAVVKLAHLIKNNYIEYSIYILLSLFILVPFKKFLGYYYGDYRSKSAEAFNVNFNQAFQRTREQAYDNEKIYVSDHIAINYLFPLGAMKIKSSEFRKNADIRFENGGYHVLHYKQFYYDMKSLADAAEPNERVVMLLKGDENVVENCMESTYTENRIDNIWRVASCNIK